MTTASSSSRTTSSDKLRPRTWLGGLAHGLAFPVGLGQFRHMLLHENPMEIVAIRFPTLLASAIISSMPDQAQGGTHAVDTMAVIDRR
eukprot:4387996-Pyramimonas_sp.AAC.1